MTSLSVIVPVLDEQDQIGSQLEALARMPGFHEVIVVDGGSQDDTCAIVEAAGTARLLRSPKGRALQMNRGAEAATGDVLLFLHADARLPSDAVEQIQGALQSGDVKAGAFAIRTELDDAAPKPFWLGPFLWLADRRSRKTSLPYGDQAIFVRALAFRQVGGYPDMPLLEDLAFSKALTRFGPIARAPGPVRVSARRFQSRPLSSIGLMRLIPVFYRMGISPERLASWYGVDRA